MSKTMESLRQDHRNFARLLKILEQELSLFDRAERPDYDVVQGIMDYFLGYPERCHHPKEDVVLRHLAKVAPDAAAKIGNLEAEHRENSNRVAKAARAIDNVLNEQEVPREAVEKAVRDFISDQRRHMHMEEERFFPAAQESLSDEDWKAIDREASVEDDPLFEGKIEERYRDVAERIALWEAEDQGLRKD
jgi:hemerythrin-like domain-containing protein